MKKLRGEAGLVLRNKELEAALGQAAHDVVRLEARVKTLVGQLSEARSHAFGMQIATNELHEWIRASNATFDAAAWQEHIKAVLEKKGFRFLTREEQAAKMAELEAERAKVVPLRPIPAAASSGGEVPLDAG